MAGRMRDPIARTIMFEIAAEYDALAVYAAKAVIPFTVTDIYRSSNGDLWSLIRDTETGRRLVRHQPNLASGGHVTETTVEEFLAVNGAGPEYQALRRMLDICDEPSRV